MTPAVDTPLPATLIVRASARQEFWFEEGCYITEWLNTPDDPELSIARARVLPGVTTRLHWLDGVAERYVILQGAGRIELVGPDQALKPGDHTVSDLDIGDVVVIPPGVSQRITNIGSDDLIFLALCTPRFQRGAYVDVDA